MSVEEAGETKEVKPGTGSPLPMGAFTKSRNSAFG